MMNATGQGPEVADENASVEATEVDSKVAETDGAESATAAAETGKTGKPPHSDELQSRFDKLTREKYEGLSRAERAEYRAQLLEQRLADLESKAKPKQVAPVDDYPTLESVGWDESAHRKAVAEWSDKRAETRAREAARAELAAEREATDRRQAETTWQQKEAEFIKSKPDYAEKVTEAGKRGDWVCSAEMASAIRRSDIGPKIAYYLAEHPEKASAIAGLHPDDQKSEIGRIAGRIDALKASPPPVSKAPAPVAKIDAGSSVVVFDPTDPDSDRLSPDEWLKRRVKQVKKLNQR